MTDAIEVNRAFYDDRWQHCWRQRFLYESISKRKIATYVLRQAGYQDGGKSVADLGFGYGQVLFTFSKTDAIAGIELAASAVERARREAGRRGFRGALFLTYSGSGPIPLGDSEYDLVICSHVLEHVPDDDSLLQEIRRIMKPGGKALLNVPINEEHVEDPLHARNYTPDGFIGQIERHGFNVTYSYEVDRLWSTFGWFIERGFNKKIPVLGFVVGAALNVFFSSIPFSLQRRLESTLLKRLKPRQLAVCVSK